MAQHENETVASATDEEAHVAFLFEDLVKVLTAESTLQWDIARAVCALLDARGLQDRETAVGMKTGMTEVLEEIAEDLEARGLERSARTLRNDVKVADTFKVHDPEVTWTVHRVFADCMPGEWVKGKRGVDSPTARLATWKKAMVRKGEGLTKANALAWLQTGLSAAALKRQQEAAGRQAQAERKAREQEAAALRQANAAAAAETAVTNLFSESASILAPSLGGPWETTASEGKPSLTVVQDEAETDSPSEDEPAEDVPAWVYENVDTALTLAMDYAQQARRIGLEWLSVPQGRPEGDRSVLADRALAVGRLLSDLGHVLRNGDPTSTVLTEAG